MGQRYTAAALVQIGITTAIFVAGRGWAHGMPWLVDDAVFTVFYLRTRNTSVCIVAHAIPNLLASSLVALGVAGTRRRRLKDVSRVASFILSPAATNASGPQLSCSSN
jgi:hypothetical protein